MEIIIDFQKSLNEVKANSQHLSQGVPHLSEGTNFYLQRLHQYTKNEVFH